MSAKGYGSRESVQAPLDLDHGVWALGEFQHLREVGPGLGWRGRQARLQDAQMVEDKLYIGMAIDERSAHVQIVPAQDVDKKVVANGRARSGRGRGRSARAWPPSSA